MMGKTVLFVASLLLYCWSLSVGAQGAGDVRFSLRGTTYQNNSLVTLEDISEGDDALLCMTDNTACCARAQSPGGGILGDWYYPNGTGVVNSLNMWEFYRNRGQSVVRLNRRRGGVNGIYHCVIPDTAGVNRTIYIGVYTADSGSPYITSLGYDNQSRTLTCTSTGGPATTVTWRRNGNMITLNATHQQTQIVTNTTTSTYQTLLTISQSVGQSVFAGIYNCAVENNRGRSSRTVVVAVNGVSVWLRGTNYQNNSLVTLEDIGEGVDALLCVTDQTACCRTPYSDSIGVSAVGNWLFPNGTRVPSSGSRWNFHRTRGHMNIVLHRREGGEEGIYHCLIPDAMTVMQTIYIGVYTASTGQVTIPGDITFQLDTDPATDPPVFTLTCTSTGGPPSTVSWRRDGTILSDDSTYSITSQVTDATTATYTHTLTVTGRLVGEYQCSVSNIRTPSGSSRTLTVGVPDPPTGFSATQVDPTSIRVSWTAPVSGAIVTGYRISYSGGTDQGSVDVGASATEHTLTITQPQTRLNYSISIITLSSSFPSSMAGPIMVTVVYVSIPGLVSSLSVTNTTLLITWDPPLTPSGDILVYEVHYQAVGGQEGGRVVNVTATSVELTGLRPESTYTISVRAYTAAGPGEERRLTVAAATTNTTRPQVLGSVSPAGAVVGTFIATTLLYTMILLVSICVLIYWNKRHRKTRKDDIQEKHTDIAMKECAAYGGVTAHSGMEAVYEHPQ